MQQKYDEALEDFDAVDQPPDDKRLIQGAYYKGQVHLEREQFKEALKAFDSVVAARRSFVSLHLFRARCLLAMGKQTEALAALDEFLASGQKYDPEAGESYGRRGRLLRLVVIAGMPPKLRPKAMVLAGQ